jgi:hypothetical protein
MRWSEDALVHHSLLPHSAFPGGRGCIDGIIHPERSRGLSKTVLTVETLEYRKRHQRTLLSRPTQCRSTPITTTAPSLKVSLDAEGAMRVRLIV